MIRYKTIKIGLYKLKFIYKKMYKDIFINSYK